MAKNKTRRNKSDIEDKEYLKGLLRKKDKRIKVLEREVSRLTKYLMRADFDYNYDENEEVVIKAPHKEEKWKCSECGHAECSEITLSPGNIARKFITCKGCGNRTRIDLNDETVDT